MYSAAKIFLLSLLLVLCSCQLLGNLGFGALGGATGAALGGPPGAAVGAGAGVLLSQAIIPEVGGSEGGGNPQGPTASTLHEAHELVSDIGWWYLLIFVLVPLFTKRGRGWVTKFVNLNGTSSKKDIDIQTARLNSLEEAVTSLKSRKRKK